MQRETLPNIRRVMLLGFVMFIALSHHRTGAGQENRAPSIKQDGGVADERLIEIANEPTTVDPSTLIIPSLAKHVTVRFDDEPLKKVFTWLQQEQALSVMVDYKALESAKVLETEPVFEELQDAPLYILLSRLEHMGIAWFDADDVIRITSQAEFQKYEVTVPYDLSQLIDDGYSPQSLVTAIKRASSSRWGATANEAGAGVLLGDVVFIHQAESVHREISGLLKALQNPARRTFALDSSRNDNLRSTLQEKFSVNFQETPLFAAVSELSKMTGIEIRLDRPVLSRANIRERTPVTLRLTEQKLHSLLTSLLSNLGLGWYLQDGALWITSQEAANDFQKTAVFDVRDLCADTSEAAALKNAIASQTRGKWRSDSGNGSVLETPKPGVLVIRNNEAVLDDVLKLLEDYRQALKVSKPRPSANPDPAEIVSGYYRLPGPMAESLTRQLPLLIEPETWKTANPDQPGSIVAITAESTTVDTKGNSVPYVVLVIRQSRSVHQSIGKFIDTLSKSKPVDAQAGLGEKLDNKQPGTFGRNLMRNPNK